MPQRKVQIIGGGLAGCEAAWVLARHGIEVDLYEMRPSQTTPAHKTGNLSELVCSNSLRSESVFNAVGILKREMRGLQSLVMAAADLARVPAGDALAVEREIFSRSITESISTSPLITVHRREMTDFTEVLREGQVIVATGPLTSPALTQALAPLVGEAQLYFYDAISPIVDGSTLDHEKVFKASRYGKGEGDDYLNCPMNEEEYYHFVRQVRNGARVLLKAFEKEVYFEGCLPIEVMADRGDLTLAYGPMKPVGLIDPRTGRQPFAVVQLRQEDREGIAYNLVGFQTKLTYPEQTRIFRLIPGLEKVDFFRLGSIHRNTYINSPQLLNAAFQLRKEPRIRFAGQITGVEGYVESSALGILVGLATAFEIQGKTLHLPPATTAMGALGHFLTGEAKADFQPMNVNFGIFSAFAGNPNKVRKEKRKEAYSERAAVDFSRWQSENGLAGAACVPVDSTATKYLSIPG